MLQRKQTIYLLLASLAIYALFFFPLVHGVYVAGKPVTIMAQGIFQDVNGQRVQTQSFLGLTVATSMLGLIPLVIITIYRDRKKQINFCYFNLVLIVGFSFWMAQAVKPIMGDTQIDTHNWGIGLLLSSVSMIFILLAIKGIKNDEKLVKSADRLR
jgi:uncharacterized membrane protein